MNRLLYISTARGPITATTIETILRTSRRNNAANGLTGLLVTGGRRFLQVLEGEPAALDATFARIAADPRHFAVVRLADNPVSERLFADWRMGHVTGGDGETVATLTGPIADPTLRAYFDGFARQHAA